MASVNCGRADSLIAIGLSGAAAIAQLRTVAGRQRPYHPHRVGQGRRRRRAPAIPPRSSAQLKTTTYGVVRHQLGRRIGC